jgi:hypothetical protein
MDLYNNPVAFVKTVLFKRCVTHTSSGHVKAAHSTCSVWRANFFWERCRLPIKTAGLGV